MGQYEVLSSLGAGGKLVFEDEDASITLASVLKSDPDWERLPDDTSRKLRELLRQCLSKDPRQRLRDIGDSRIEIEEVITEWKDRLFDLHTFRGPLADL